MFPKSSLKCLNFIGTFGAGFLLFQCLTTFSHFSSEEGFGVCNELVEYVFKELEGVAGERNTLQREKFVEVRDLKQQLKDLRKTTTEAADNCTRKVRGLEGDVELHKDARASCQSILDSAAVNMERTSAVMVDILRALKDAEQKNEQLELQIASLKNGSTSTQLASAEDHVTNSTSGSLLNKSSWWKGGNPAGVS